MSRLRLFVDSSWKIEGERPTWLLYPFWGTPSYENTPFLRKAFSQFSPDTEHYAITDVIEDADIILNPYPEATRKPNVQAIREEVFRKARSTSKKVLTDALGDLPIDVSEENAISIRYASYRSLIKKNEIVIPLFSEDLLESYFEGKITLLSKTEKPEISFVGWAELRGLKLLRALLKDTPTIIASLWNRHAGAMRKGLFFRRWSIRALLSSEEVTFNLKERVSFGGHSKTAESDPKVLRREFVEAIESSLYGLDVRGDANNSVRFFEILSMGRIPIVIDTERVFPFEERINYSEFVLKVDWRDLRNLPLILVDFHKKMSEADLMTMQKKARLAFVEHLRIDSMTKELVSEVKKKIGF